MKAFAVPAFTDGQVRINVAGRDGRGVVAARDYEVVCAEVTAALQRLRHGRTGAPVVKAIHRTRKSPYDGVARPEVLRRAWMQSSTAPTPFGVPQGVPPAGDLIIVWRDDPLDLIDSPDAGRIGPLPFYRTAGHHNEGFLLAAGPGIAAGSELPDGETVDLAPTILRSLEAPIGNHFEGHPLIQVAQLV